MRLVALFAHVLHIRPWEIADLPLEEFRALCDWLDEYNRVDEES